MNIQEYIESGIIELYVMNALPQTEMVEVEDMAGKYPDIQAEIEDVQAVMQVYSQAHAIAPSTELKDKILNKISNEIKSQPNQPSLEKPHLTADSPKASLPAQSSVVEKGAGWASAVSILAGLAALLFGGLAFYMYQQNQTLNKQKVDCEQAQNTLMLKNQKEIADLGMKLNILKSLDTKEIPLNGLPAAPEFRATVYWNAKEKATLLTIQNLPKPADDKQYQLWAIVGKNKPVDAGVFNYNLTEIHTMKVFEKVETFAVTLEPEGGSAVPTLDKMYVIGSL